MVRYIAYGWYVLGAQTTLKDGRLSYLHGFYGNESDDISYSTSNMTVPTRHYVTSIECIDNVLLAVFLLVVSPQSAEGRGGRLRRQ